MNIIQELKNAFQQLYTSGVNNAITPSDTLTLDFLPRAIYVGEGGDITIEDQNNNEVTFSNVASGTVLPIKPKMVKSTGTTATNLISLS